MRGSAQLKTVGKRRWPVSEISVKQLKGGKIEKGVWRRPWADPYIPEKITDPYHPGGNSVCYMIQTAHLMGCDPIYLLGFTLSSGSTYFFGRDNPVRKRPPLYEVDRAIHWLSWYEERYPGRVRLVPGWDGPICDVFSTDKSIVEV